MTNNIQFAGTDGNLSVSHETAIQLPAIIVNYLWELALSEDYQMYEKQTFLLEAVELGGRSLQDIYHFGDQGNAVDKRRVFGFEPVTCDLQIINDHGRYQMQLSTGR